MIFFIFLNLILIHYYKIKIIEDFFKENDSYNDEKLKKADITEDELSEYADLELGIKIRDHIKDFGQCSFQAEF